MTIDETIATLPTISRLDATSAWLSWLERILVIGNEVTPRGQGTLEVPHLSASFDLHYCVVNVPERKLSWKFMAAEALWILAGDDRVSSIEPYNKKIADYSDDGRTFYGAYGPKFKDQLVYVVKAIVEDLDTRQAVMTFWRENPRKTKDVPCTVALQFTVRNAKLNVHVFMRSSDAWLGVPYDWFNFAMLGLRVAQRVNAKIGSALVHDLGRLYFTAGSAHLYDRNREATNEILNRYLVSLSTFDRPRPTKNVARWIARQASENLVTDLLRRARAANRPPSLRT